MAEIGELVRERRKVLAMEQKALAAAARVSVTTLSALENGRLAEIGVRKLSGILDRLRLDLSVTEARRSRPTLEQLREEADAERLDRR